MLLQPNVRPLLNEHGLEFSWDLAYGMGGWYTGAGSEDWYQDEWDEREEGKGYWASSSQSC